MSETLKHPYFRSFLLFHFGISSQCFLYIRFKFITLIFNSYSFSFNLPLSDRYEKVCMPFTIPSYHFQAQRTASSSALSTITQDYQVCRIKFYCVVTVFSQLSSPIILLINGSFIILHLLESVNQIFSILQNTF